MRRIVSYPSISGIMMSIRTMSTSLRERNVSMPCMPLSALRHVHPVRTERGLEREDVARVVVDDEYAFGEQRRSVEIAAGRLLRRSKVGFDAVQEEIEFVQQSLRRVAVFHDDRRGEATQDALRRRGVSSRPV